MSDKPELKVYVQSKAYKKFRYFIDLCETEISGLGKVEKIGNRLVVTDFQIFKQVVSGAHSDIDDDALAAFLYEMTVAKEDLSKWRVWWHSHAAMAVFFSGTDTNTIDRSVEFPWLVSIVGNHDGDIKARIDVFEPIRCTEDLVVEIIEDEDPALKELCLKEIKEKVTQERSVGFFPLSKKEKEKKTYYHGDNRFEDDDYHEHMRR